MTWDFKSWAVADTSGYPLDFSVYTGKKECTDYGPTLKVVMDLLKTFWFQGYKVYVNTFRSQLHIQVTVKQQ